VETGPGEHVIFEGHPSWRAVLGFYIKGALIAAVAGGIAALVTAIADDEVKVAVVVAVAAVVAGLVVLAGLLRRISTVYTVTNQRLNIRRGIISRKVQETRLERVQNVNTDQSALERILQVGTVDFDTAGTTDSEFAFVGVSQPEKVMAAVNEAQREHAADPTGGLGGAPSSPPEAST
jgi:uncharacterized membrane protein YdbT with pleckstrin-like domain